MAIHNIFATLTSDKKLTLEGGANINQGENKVTALKIALPALYTGYDYTLEFSCPHNRVYQTAELSTVTDATRGNLLYYEIESCLTYERGLVLMQLVAHNSADNSIVFKSVKNNQSSFWVNASVNYVPLTYAVNDFFTQSKNSLDQLTTLTQTLASDGQTAIAAAATANSVAAQLLADKADGLFKGDKGDVNTLSIGSVSRGATASATITGASPNQTLNLVLPKGDAGQKGDTGARGSIWHKGKQVSGSANITVNDSTLAQNTLVNDLYANTDSGDYYVCDSVSANSTLWSYCGNLKGASGISTLTTTTALSGFADGTVLYSDGNYVKPKAVDSIVSANSQNLITSGAVNTALALKQNLLTFDESVTQNSQNCVTSGKVFDALFAVKPMVFNNVAIVENGFVADATNADYPYRASVTLSLVTANMSPNVSFSLEQALSGLYAPIADSYNGGVYLYAKSTNPTAITIPTILLIKGAQ